MANRKLTPKQQRFVAEYLVDLNATQASIRAGYSKKMASRIGYQLLEKTRVQEALREAKEKQQQRTNITADDVLRELFRLATFDPRKLFNPDGTPKKITELDDDTAACVGGLDIVERMAGDKENPEIESIKKVKVWDKNAALEKLCKHLQLYAPEQIEHTGKDGDPIQHDHTHDHQISAAAQEMLDRMLGRGRDDDQADE